MLAPYPIPDGVYPVADDLLDLRPDEQIDDDILRQRPVTGVKNIWFYWHNGFAKMHPYGQRTVRAWHCRFSKQGWVVRVVDSEPGSPSNIAEWLDTRDPALFPRAFAEGTIAGAYRAQHTSDLVRFPLLLRYGGVYADVGMMQIGDLDRLWNKTVGDASSPWEMLTYNAGSIETRALTNYFLGALPDNPLLLRSHQLLLALWAEDGGRTCTDDMHKSPLLRELPLHKSPLSFEEEGRLYSPGDVSRLLADYIIQGTAMTMVMSTQEEHGWDGPAYAAHHIYAMEYMEGSQLINEVTNWQGPRQFELMSLRLPLIGQPETADQKLAREIVEACLRRSFGFKLATGLIIRVLGQTLSSLWRDNPGSDDVPGTYAHWLRYGMRYWSQRALPDRMDFQVLKPVKVGPILRGS